jgi:hypothetical protein
LRGARRRSNPVFGTAAWIASLTLAMTIRFHIKIAARKDGVKTLVDVASLKAYYEALPLKTDPAPLVVRPSGHGEASPRA